MDKLEKLQKKYAKVILDTCLKVKKNQKLFISANSEVIKFVRILSNVAYELGIKDIYYDLTDQYLKHDALKNLDVKDLKKMQFWNKEKWNEYASDGAAFVMLVTENPGLMKDIDPKKLSDLTMYSYETRKKFDELRDKSMVPWCIAGVPSLLWAQEVFPKSKTPEEDLWNEIFKICQITKPNPEKVIEEKINNLSRRCDKLNSYKFKTLEYTNSLGTDFTIELPDNHLWASGKSKLVNKEEVLVNFPTEEVFTSPTNNSASGIVYSAKPLCYQDNLIEDFWIKFDKGVAVDCKAKKGEKILKQLISSCPNSNKLGEVALVEYNSPISESKIIFYETLYDENAACHLALGASFPECIKNGPQMSKEELKKNKLNDCNNHVDFMIGTEDLNIVGTTVNGEKIKIFENGNFTKEFK